MALEDFSSTLIISADPTIFSDLPITCLVTG